MSRALLFFVLCLWACDDLNRPLGHPQSPGASSSSSSSSGSAASDAGAPSSDMDAAAPAPTITPQPGDIQL
jgi:hypothetical protein